MTEFKTEWTHVPVAIIGAGIGGAAAAIALRQAGLEVEVFEQAPELREVGGAIVIREPSMALLARWGVLDALRPKMVAVNQIEIRDRNGFILDAVSTAIEAGESEFAYCVHRADLHDALISKLSPRQLHLGHRLVRIESTSDHAEATFENGRHIRTPLIIGADGLRSIVRTFLDTTPMTFLKMVVHRTIVPSSLLPAGMPNDRIRLWQRGDLRLNLIPIRSGAEISVSAAIPAQEPPKSLWSSTSADQMLSAFAEFDLLITRLIEGRIVDITTHPVYDKEPIERWSDGHLVLLGDAAHPMAPMNGQGANQAIQDCDALATALTSHNHHDLASALAAYQSIRAPITARIQMLSRTPPPALARFAKAAR